jgi:phosphoglycerate kinase
MGMRDVDGLETAIGGFHGRRVLVRSDLNVPVDRTGDRPLITDDGRIRASVPTIRRLSRAGAVVVVCAHLGRPTGAPDPQYGLAPVAERLGELLGRPVRFVPEPVGPQAEAAVRAAEPGDVVLLENLRFDPGETSKDDAVRGAFADRLAALADAFVSDGFGVVHRKQASVYDVALRLPHAVGGLVLAEVQVLRRLTDDVTRPYAVVLGGAKVSDKLAVIENLLGTADRLLVGGGMVFTFLAAQGWPVGRSLLEADQVDAVRGQLADAAARGVEIVLPTDIVAATEVSPDAEHAVVPADGIPDDRIGVDIGPESTTLFARRLADCRTVFWNGPMGVFEVPAFASGTRGVAEALRGLDGALTVIGGGDSAAAVRALGFRDEDFGHVSTGGGASLEYLEGTTLPGLEVLEGEA